MTSIVAAMGQPIRRLEHPPECTPVHFRQKEGRVITGRVEYARYATNPRAGAVAVEVADVGPGYVGPRRTLLLDYWVG